MNLLNINPIHIISPLLLLITSALCFSSCSGSNSYNPEKMDSDLTRQIQAAEKENPDALIQFTGKCSSDINQEMRIELESRDINIGTVIRDIFTAEGRAESIKKISMLEFIVYLESAKRLDIK
jgi:hypothetical protein